MLRFGVSLILLTLSACLYSMSGGGGFPSHIRTVAVLPFDNETASPELTAEIHERLRKSLASRLGLREAPEGRANAIVRGTITEFESDVPVAFSADPSRATSARRKVELLVNVEIVDQSTGMSLFERKGIRGEGEYEERKELEGRQRAIDRIIELVIEGAQSQW